MKHLEILHALVCDDARREDNGKDILIGVYSSDIRVTRFPITLRLVLWLQAMIKSTDPVKLELQVLGPNNAQLATANIELEVPRPDSVGSIPLGPMSVQIQSEGALVFKMRDASESTWEQILSMPVALASPAGHQ
jgi:Family of unknown function (DUF6941)